MKATDRAGLQGLAAGLAEIIRLHQCEVETADVLQGFGISETDLRNAGVDADDMAALRPALDMCRP